MNEWIWILVIVVVLMILVRILFASEIKACFERDPASRDLVEILLCYPGLHAIIAYRIAHLLYWVKLPILPRLIMTLARWITGVEIHPAAMIGKGLFIDHGMGVVIGETTVIADNVTLFQGVTLGGTGKGRGKRHPTIGSRVVIGTGAKVLGNISIGEDSMIGANAVVVREVPPHSTVVGVPGRITRIKDRHFKGISLDHSHLPDPLKERLEKLQHEIDELDSHLKEHKEGSEGPSS